MNNNKKYTLFIIKCISNFAEKNNINIKDSFLYLNKYNCIQYLIENYDIEHTLSKDDTLEAMYRIAHNNGGHII
ncbi:MAG: DUF3791 domain-containing protein [Treponema sp.]|nr:DUF3791 domain-containing protein [Treponema sp.]